MRGKPDFLGIGAARSGTTWLSRVLSNHPEVWIPRRKELHYWSRSSKYFSPAYLEVSSPLPRLLGPGAESKRFRRELVKAFGRDFLSVDWEQLRWDARYFFGHCDDRWYRTLFDGRGERLTGEITPAYALLDDADVEHIAELYPDLKILYIIRDPVERAWSTACYHELRGWIDLEDMSIEEMEEYLSRSNVLSRSSYSSVISRWIGAFGSDNFFLAFYDEIQENPQHLFDRLVSFLGLSQDEHQSSSLGQRVNASSSRPIPAQLKETLARQYRDEIHDVSRSVGGYAKEWRQRYFRDVAS